MKQRIITGVIGAAIFLTMVFVGGLPFTLFILALATVGLYELLRMKNIPLFSFIGIVSLCLMWLLLLPRQTIQISFLFEWEKIDVFLFLLFLLLMFMVISKNKITFDEVGFVIVSSLYVGFGFHYLVETRNIPEIGLALVFFVIFLIWSTDSGAYFIGRKFGKRKLWPEISPKKTVEGSVGGIATAFVIGSILQFWLQLFSSVWTFIFVILVVSVSGQIGDLIESAIKRHYGVKDSGNLLPGHGGVLDRFDSLIYVFPLLHLLHLI